MRVRLFASLREAAGWSERVIRADTPHITPADLWQQLGLSTPAAPAPAAGSPPQPDAEPLPAGVRVAINQQFASSRIPLADGDELAFLPPITGG